jgi:hypothetical protein
MKERKICDRRRDEGSPEGGVVSPTHHQGTLPAFRDIYSTRCHRKSKKIIKDLSNPNHD